MTNAPQILICTSHLLGKKKEIKFKFLCLKVSNRKITGPQEQDTNSLNELKVYNKGTKERKNDVSKSGKNINQWGFRI